jgi:hypothetical protein
MEQLPKFKPGELVKLRGKKPKIYYNLNEGTICLVVKVLFGYRTYEKKGENLKLNEGGYFISEIEERFEAEKLNAIKTPAYTLYSFADKKMITLWEESLRKM